MALLRGLLDRAVLIAGVVAGGMVPSYLAQYRQRVGGALGQALKDLAPFQQIADRFHDGSLAKLIQHHLASTDPSFHAEGAAIQAIADSVASLRNALAALDTDVFHQLAYLARQADPAMAQATWDAFRPSFGITADSLLMAAAFGLSIWVVFLCVWLSIAALWRRRARLSGAR
jgi:aminopeptidase N